MRKVVWAVVVAVFLSSAPVPAAAAPATYASCRKKVKKAKFKYNAKYKAPKFKKGHKRRR